MNYLSNALFTYFTAICSLGFVTKNAILSMGHSELIVGVILVQLIHNNANYQKRLKKTQL